MKKIKTLDSFFDILLSGGKVRTNWMNNRYIQIENNRVVDNNKMPYFVSGMFFKNNWFVLEEDNEIQRNIEKNTTK